MNCDQFSEIIGMRCNQLGSATEVISPFTFADGNGIELFAQERGEQVHYFDDGFTLTHIHNVGIQLGDNRKRWSPLKNISEAYGVYLSDNGVFETMCPKKDASQGFARIMSALIRVAAWEREQIGVNQDATFLIEEVSLYLRAWKPTSNIIESPSVTGFSGRSLTFDFEFDGQYIDAIHPHFASTGAELRKIIDYNSISNQRGMEVFVIVDDRVNKVRAKQEIGIIGRVAKTWPLSSLISASGVMLVSPSGERLKPN